MIEFKNLKTLKSLEVIFKALETSSAYLTSAASTASKWPQQLQVLLKLKIGLNYLEMH